MNDLQSVTKSLSEKEKIGAIIWLVIGILQCFSFSALYFSSVFCAAPPPDVLTPCTPPPTNAPDECSCHHAASCACAKSVPYMNARSQTTLSIRSSFGLTKKNLVHAKLRSLSFSQKDLSCSYGQRERNLCAGAVYSRQGA